MIELTELQQSFFHALLAPFHEQELSHAPGRGTSELTYIDKRAIENRLDTVCGLGGWYPAYRSIEPGLIVCELSILVPGPEATMPPTLDNGWYWMAKEDGAGYEGMTKKSGGEMIVDSDNDSKSAITNALRRAAQDAWGIGRFLYRKGVVGWLSLENPPLTRTPARLPVGAYVMPADISDEVKEALLEEIRKQHTIQHDVNEYGVTVDFSPESRVKTAVAGSALRFSTVADATVVPGNLSDLPQVGLQAGKAGQLAGSQGDPAAREAGNLPAPKLPAEEITSRPRDVQPEPDPVVPDGTVSTNGPVKGETTTIELTPSSKSAAIPINLPRDSRSAFNWAKRMEGIFDQRLVQGMTREAIDKGYPRGMAEWSPDQLSDICLSVVCHLVHSPKYQGEFDHLSDQVVEHLNKPAPATAASPGINLADLRKKIITSLEALIKYQTGQDATTDQCREMLQEIAPQCKNSNGTNGEVPERLGAIVDASWLANIQQFVDEQISHAKSNMATETGKDCPF